MEINTIEASLEFGKFINGIMLKILYLLLFISILVPLSAVILFLKQILSGHNWNADSFVNALGICSILFIISLVYFLFLLIKNNKLKRKILIWLEDAVELKATSETVDSHSEYISVGAYNKKKIKVSFVYKSKKIAIESGTNNDYDNKYDAKNGYDSIFRKYADREIDILFSPKYKQILLLKGQNNYI